MKSRILMITTLAFFILVGFQPLHAKDLYVAKTGDDNVSYANNSILNPWATPKKAVASVLAGDTVYIRQGTYTLTSSIQTSRSGSASSPITIKAFPDEQPILSISGVGEIFYIEHPYWIIGGLTLQSSNMPDHDHGIISVGYNNDAHHFTIHNSSLHVVNSLGRDNISCIRLQASRSNYAYIYFNTLQGQGAGGTTYRNSGVQYLGGQNVGTKILNNEIYDCELGVYVKHANNDTAETGAEVAYNYLHDNKYDIYGNPVRINYHDNLLTGGGMLFGDNGGGSQGTNCTLNHNTVEGVIELWSPSEGPITNFTITNNIFASRITYGSTLSLNSWDYNIYTKNSAEGPNDIGNTTPVYLRDRSPLTPPVIAGFRLHKESAGYLGGNDGKNIGADTTKVGPLVRPSLN